MLDSRDPGYDRNFDAVYSEQNGWMFLRIEEYSTRGFYSFPYEPVEGLWDAWSRYDLF